MDELLETQRGGQPGGGVRPGITISSLGDLEQMPSLPGS